MLILATSRSDIFGSSQFSFTRINSKLLKSILYYTMNSFFNFRSHINCLKQFNESIWVRCEVLRVVLELNCFLPAELTGVRLLMRAKHHGAFIVAVFAAMTSAAVGSMYTNIHFISLRLTIIHMI